MTQFAHTKEATALRKDLRLNLWSRAKLRERTNHGDLQRERSQGTNPMGRLVHQRRERESNTERRVRVREKQREREGGVGERVRETERRKDRKLVT